MPIEIESVTHLVLVPSYNTGPILARTVRALLDVWHPVLLVIDGSDDGSGSDLDPAHMPGLQRLVLPRNGGKGAAVLAGLRWARERGYSHVLVFDADGQHPADHVAAFMARSQSSPAAMILGVPQFAAAAPALRVKGRRVSNWWARVETGGRVADSLFGFRVYPVAALCAVMERTRFMRRFDFDPEAAVRLCWAGVAAVNVPAPVRYLARSEGGVSHFRYARDNLLLTWMHVRLVLGWLGRGCRGGGGARPGQQDGAQPPRPQRVEHKR